MTPASPAPGTGGSTGRFPIPLVGAVAILLVLIVFTPILYGPAGAGTFETQAELIIDQAPGSGVTTFYVHAVGDTVRYASIAIGVAGNLSWTGRCATPSAASWTVWENRSEMLEADVSTSANPVTVWAIATYTAGGATAVYSAEIAFNVGAGSLAAAVCFGATPPSGGEPLSGLPLVLLMQDWGSSGPSP